MRKWIFNSTLVLAALALLVFLAFQVRWTPVADKVAVLRTMGMTCGSCAGKVEKGLTLLPGIAGVEVDVNGGWVLVGYDSKSAEPERFVDAVGKSGFQSWLIEQMSVTEFRKVAGRDFGSKSTRGGCCGKDGCGS